MKLIVYQKSADAMKTRGINGNSAFKTSKSLMNDGMAMIATSAITMIDITPKKAGWKGCA